MTPGGLELGDEHLHALEVDEDARRLGLGILSSALFSPEVDTQLVDVEFACPNGEGSLPWALWAQGAERVLQGHGHAVDPVAVTHRIDAGLRYATP